MTLHDTDNELIELHISDIDKSLAVRSDDLDFNHVDALREVLDLLPPITVRPWDGNPNYPYQLIDGAHRCAAFHFVNRRIPAVVVELDDIDAVMAGAA